MSTATKKQTREERVMALAVQKKHRVLRLHRSAVDAKRKYYLCTEYYKAVNIGIDHVSTLKEIEPYLLNIGRTPTK